MTLEITTDAQAEAARGALMQDGLDPCEIVDNNGTEQYD